VTSAVNRKIPLVLLGVTDPATLEPAATVLRLEGVALAFAVGDRACLRVAILPCSCLPRHYPARSVPAAPTPESVTSAPAFKARPHQLEPGARRGWQHCPVTLYS
jgi:hypothetical protein